MKSKIEIVAIARTRTINESRIMSAFMRFMKRQTCAKRARHDGALGIPAAQIGLFSTLKKGEICAAGNDRGGVARALRLRRADFEPWRGRSNF